MEILLLIGIFSIATSIYYLINVFYPIVAQITIDYPKSDVSRLKYLMLGVFFFTGMLSSIPLFLLLFNNDKYMAFQFYLKESLEEV